MYYIYVTSNVGFNPPHFLRYQFHVVMSVLTKFDSSLPPVVCRGAHVLFMLFGFVYVYSGVQHVLTIRVAWRVSYKKQELLNLREQLSSSAVFRWRPCCSTYQFFSVLQVYWKYNMGDYWNQKNLKCRCAIRLRQYFTIISKFRLLIT